MKRYGEVVAVNGVTASFEPGIVNVLLGPNGSGKSTLMKMAVGLVKPDEGKVTVDGMDPSADPVSIKRIVGYAPEEIMIYESLTPAETFSFLGSVYGIPHEELERRVKLLIRLFKLEEQMSKFGGELSHGNRRKVLLASALLHEPKVLVLDEPFNGLDPEAGRVLKELLKKYVSEGRTVLVSTHILELAEAIADRITIMHAGRVVATGTPEELEKEAKDLESAFMRATGLSSELQELLKALWGS